MLTTSGAGDRRHRAVSISVAGAGAIPQFTHCVPGTPTVFLVVRSEVTGMTAGTIGLVGSTRPGNRLAVAGMAVCAGNAGTMIPRIGGGTVREINGCPTVDAVTAIALHSGAEMSSRLTGCGGTVMAVGTGAGSTGVIETGRQPRQR